ncbi:MAG TPA: hydantoinase/oxoprolinase family protein [Solirubrobacteraceae bacterium]|jgi:N-methylhydantoinase A
MMRIGVDVGGTFTDVVVLDEESGSTSWLKLPTNEREPAVGVLEAMAATEVPLSEVSHVKVGTTLGVNAVLTRSGACTGLITTKGFRDVLEIRRTHRQRLFDLDEQIPEPLIPRDRRLEVSERMDADGNVVQALDEEGVRAAWLKLREAGVRSLAIVFLFSFENPSHEQRAREIVLREGGAEAVFISSEVLPVHREYERTSTTAMAAYVAPAMRAHLADLGERLKERGLKPGRLSIMTSSGGVLGSEAVANAPIPSLLSGPAGGVTGAHRLAFEADIENALTLDMGGTSCDVSGIVQGRPDERLDIAIDGLAVSYPTFDIHTIGAGGGSIAWIDPGGALRVGPGSAGADPGPACYGLGGEQPTVTDANLILGRYDPGAPLGGALSLDMERAREAVQRAIAQPLEITVEQAAAGIVRIVNAHMEAAVRTISLERGRDVRDFTLVAFGGAGPVHGADVARELGIERILVPPCPGCTSALGAVAADARHDLVRTIARPMREVRAETVRSTVDGMRTQAQAALAQEGFGAAESLMELWLDLRYEGQAHELSVRCPEAFPAAPAPEPAFASVLAEAVGRFHRLHEQLYGHSFPDMTVELVNMRVTGHGIPPSPGMWWDWSKTAAPERGMEKQRKVYFLEAREFLDTRVLRRREIEPEQAIEGPAVIHQLDATVLIPPGNMAVAHPSGSLILTSPGQALAELEDVGTMQERR